MALILWLAALLLVATPSAPGAAGAAPIAQVKTLMGKVVIQRSGQRLPANIGDPLFEKDIIETGPDGGIGITFIDNTVFSTGRTASSHSMSFSSTRIISAVHCWPICGKGASPSLLATLRAAPPGR